jgi:uncharacterized protein (DUF362 family)/Pyruvate/2-oxoacid:ferredoxin oxidoreductase delta subunit
MVVQAIAELAREAGAARIWIADSCAGDHPERALWDKTGMSEVARNCGAELKSFTGSLSSHRVGKGRVPVPEWLAQVDTVISLPKLKTHALTGLTCAMKNVYGLVAREAKSAYHGSHPSPRSMSRFLVEVYLALRPDLSIVDAIEAMEGEGPANGRPKHLGLLLAGTDEAAIDTLCARMLPGGQRQAPMLAAAREMGAGVTEEADIAVMGDGRDALLNATLEPSKGRFLLSVPDWLFRPVSRLLASRPRVRDELCIRCGVCAGICSRNAVCKQEDGRYVVDDRRCILCMCCAESCPRHAIYLRSPFDLFARVRRLAQSLSGTKKERT